MISFSTSSGDAPEEVEKEIIQKQEQRHNGEERPEVHVLEHAIDRGIDIKRFPIDVFDLHSARFQNFLVDDLHLFEETLDVKLDGLPNEPEHFVLVLGRRDTTGQIGNVRAVPILTFLYDYQVSHELSSP